MAETNGVASAASPAPETVRKSPDPSSGAQAQQQAPVSTIANGVSINEVPYAHATSNGLNDSTNDTGASRRPKDARLVHLMLASLGVTSYQERVPLALMDIAHRYTSAILHDALLYNDTANPSSASNPNAANITLSDLRMSIASRVNHQFISALPKEFMLSIADERNKIALPQVKREWGVRLPPEQYCLTGVNWELIVGEEESSDGGDDDGEGEEDGEGEAEGDEMEVEKDGEAVGEDGDKTPTKDEDMEDRDLFVEAEEVPPASTVPDADEDAEGDEEMGGV